MNEKIFWAIIIPISILVIILGIDYFYVPKPDSTPKSVPGGISNLGPSSPDDPAFFDEDFKDFTKGLNRKEETVTYIYPNSPCGTLTTQFSEIGSVRVGRGPVYSLASEQCKIIDSNYVPNDFSFRVYACENIDNGNGIQGKATFAFQCSLPNEDTRCLEARINEENTQPDWNCEGF